VIEQDTSVAEEVDLLPGKSRQVVAEAHECVGTEVIGMIDQKLNLASFRQTGGMV
jgi:hypothetical protein